MTLVRTNQSHPEFRKLVQQLDAYLAEKDGTEHAFYDQFNGIEDLDQVVLVMQGDQALACGAFKPMDPNSVEIKRMFTPPDYRRKGYAAQVLTELERWAKELGYSACLLETGKRQREANDFYPVQGYVQIPNYGPYADKENSVCFEKRL